MKKAILFSIILITSYFNTMAQEYYPGDDGKATIKIPVLFHVIYKDIDYKEYINENLLTNIVNRVNNNFNHVDTERINEPYNKIVAQCNIEFYIPNIAYDENGNAQSAISYHYSNKSYTIPKEYIFIEHLYEYDPSVKQYGYVNSSKYLNIWICHLNSPKHGGYSTFPQEIDSKNDGIVINDIILNKEEKQYIANYITHEIGHWLGLYHIWGKRNDNPKCKKDDEVSDTPKQKGPNRDDFYGKHFDEMLPTCGNPNIKSNYQNFMDYTYHKYSMFTEGQKKKMRFNIYKYRSEFLENNNENDIADSFTENNNYLDNQAIVTIHSDYNKPLTYKLTNLSGFAGQREFYLKENAENYVERRRYLVEIFQNNSSVMVAQNIIDLSYSGQSHNVVIDIAPGGCAYWHYDNESAVRKFGFYNDYNCKYESYSSNTSARNYTSTQQTENHSSQNKNTSSYNSQDNVLRPAPSVKPGHSANNTNNNKATQKFVHPRTLNTIRRKTNNQVPVEVKIIQKQSTQGRVNSPYKRNIQRPKPLNRPRTNTYNRKVTRPQSHTLRFLNQSTKPYTRTRPGTRSTKPLSRTTRAQTRRTGTQTRNKRSVYNTRTTKPRTRQSTGRKSIVKTRRTSYQLPACNKKRHTTQTRKVYTRKPARKNSKSSNNRKTKKQSTTKKTKRLW